VPNHLFVFTPIALGQIRQLYATQPKLVLKLLTLLEDKQQHPYDGIGKPEPLKHHLSGFWSRRINNEHRLIYRIQDEKIEVIACFGHY